MATTKSPKPTAPFLGQAYKDLTSFDEVAKSSSVNAYLGLKHWIEKILKEYEQEHIWRGKVEEELDKVSSKLAKIQSESINYLEFNHKIQQLYVVFGDNGPKVNSTRDLQAFCDWLLINVCKLQTKEDNIP